MAALHAAERRKWLLEKKEQKLPYSKAWTRHSSCLCLGVSLQHGTVGDAHCTIQGLVPKLLLHQGASLCQTLDRQQMQV